MPIIANEDSGRKNLPLWLRFLGGCWKNMVGFFEVYGKAMQICDGHRHIANEEIHRLQLFFTNLLHLVVNDEHEDCGGIIYSMSLW